MEGESSEPQRHAVADFWRKHWFLTTLAVMIAGGIALGYAGAGPALAPIFGHIDPRWTTACVLLLMSFSLDSEHLWDAFRSPRPVLLGCLMNYGLVPLLAWVLAPWQQHVDLRVGLMIAASVPCTAAAASVMTRKARGNDAVSLLITVGTNLSCFVLTPLWLEWTTEARVELDTVRLMIDLVVAVLVPSVMGQLLRLVPPLHRQATRYRTGIGTVAQMLIELLVLTAALRAGTVLHDMRSTPDVRASRPEPVAVSTAAEVPATDARRSPVTLEGVAIAWASGFAVHLAALAAGWWLAQRSGRSRAEAIAVAFAGSQKTLPIGLYIATDPGLFGDAHPFAMLPMLLYHASQLFFDSWLASRLMLSPRGADFTPTRSSG